MGHPSPGQGLLPVPLDYHIEIPKGGAPVNVGRWCTEEVRTGAGEHGTLYDVVAMLEHRRAGLVALPPAPNISGLLLRYRRYFNRAEGPRGGGGLASQAGSEK